MSNEGLMITGLYGKDIKGVKIVDLEFDAEAGLILVKGRNGGGKSSLMDILPFTIGGKREVQEQPIRDGQKKAKTVVRLTPPGGDTPKYEIQRTYTDKGSYLKITGIDDSDTSSEQKILDGLRSDFTFDVMEFARMNNADQRATLINALGIGESIEPIDKERSAAADERKIAKRQVANCEGALKQIEDAPDEDPGVTDIEALIVEKDRINDLAKLNEDAQLLIDRLELEVESLQMQLGDVIAKHKSAVDSLAELDNPNVDRLGEIEEELAGANETNNLRLKWLQKQNSQSELDNANKRLSELEATIEMCDETKKSLIAMAESPVEGLAFDDDCVTRNGIPFDQLSAAEQTETSLAIGMELNSELRAIRIMDGSLLDSQMLAVIERMAIENGYQILVEMVEERQPVWKVNDDNEFVVDSEGNLVQATDENGELSWEYPEAGLFIQEGEIVAIDGEEVE